jgi:uncharacterized protein (DUF2384 family)
LSALAPHEYDLRMPTSPSSASDRAARCRRVLTEATAALGADAAQTYLHTGNFALGGTTPAELLQSSKGERVVLNELRTHLECGPL